MMGAIRSPRIHGCSGRPNLVEKTKSSALIVGASPYPDLVLLGTAPLRQIARLAKRIVRSSARHLSALVAL